MRYFDWDKEKNKKLKIERGILFEEIVIIITQEKILDIIHNPNKKHYPNQNIYIIEINDYVYLVPFVKDDEKYFLKTIIPSRKMTKKYLRGGENK